MPGAGNVKLLLSSWQRQRGLEGRRKRKRSTVLELRKVRTQMSVRFSKETQWTYQDPLME